MKTNHRKIGLIVLAAGTLAGVALTTTGPAVQAPLLRPSAVPAVQASSVVGPESVAAEASIRHVGDVGSRLRDATAAGPDRVVEVGGTLTGRDWSALSDAQTLNRLVSTGRPEARRALYMVLGQSGARPILAWLVGHARHEQDPGARSGLVLAVAQAGRPADLLALAGTPALGVSHRATALRALGNRTGLSLAEREALATIVRGHELPELRRAALVALINNPHGRATARLLVANTNDRVLVGFKGILQARRQR